MTDKPLQEMRKFGTIHVFTTDVQGAIDKVMQAIETRSPQLFSFCNAATVNLSHRSPEFSAALQNAVLFNDGIGIDVASKILYGSFFPKNLNGTDLMPALFRSLDRPISVYLLGSLPGIAEKAGRAIEGYDPHVKVVGTHDGYFELSETPRIVKEIAATSPDLLLVGMGQPRQELWSVSVIEQLGIPIICFGAFMDFASGRIPRAPPAVRAMRIEWLYRLAMEPRRLFGRYIGGAIPYFVRVVAQRFHRG